MEPIAVMSGERQGTPMTSRPLELVNVVVLVWGLMHIERAALSVQHQWQWCQVDIVFLKHRAPPPDSPATRKFQHKLPAKVHRVIQITTPLYASQLHPSIWTFGKDTTPGQIIFQQQLKKISLNLHQQTMVQQESPLKCPIIIIIF